MKILKNIWIYIILGVGVIIAILSTSKNTSTKKVKVLNDKIKSNESETKKVQEKIDVVVKEKEQIKDDIDSTKKELTIIKDVTPTVVVKTSTEAHNSIKNRIKK
jgi:peptidoglycan hydrolase CwlO-like protein